MSKFSKKQIITKWVTIGLATPLFIGTLIALGYGNHLAFDVYPNNLKEFFNQGGGGSSGGDSESRAKGNDLARELVREGIVMLKNEDDTLPLSKSIKKVNVFGYNSVDWYYCGSGSGRILTSGEKMYDICKGLEENGIEYNKELYNFYYNYRTPTGLGGPDASNPWTIGTTAEKFCVLVEPALTPQIKSNAESFSKTAIVSLGRKGGESEDLPRAQYKYKAETDTTKTYLDASDEEIELLTYCGSHFDNVIVVINSTNAMCLDFLDTIPGIDSCLIVGNTGLYGATGIYDVMFGDYSPSGKLTDTYAYDFKSNITYFHSSYEHTGNYLNSNSGSWPYNRNYKGRDEKTVFYSDYVEGIYVGYKWFETADAEHYWDNAPYNGYDNVVQFPFGYGMSYTSFSWELEELSLPKGSELPDTKETIDIKVKVKNTGLVAGKDVVEVYLTAPYIAGGIEKSYVSLVGFAKTPLIKPNESATVEINVKVSDFESYDCYDKNNNGHVGYELDEGTYELKFMTDSHTLKEGMEDNVISYVLSDTVNIDFDEISGQKVTNLFTGENAVDGFAIDGSNAMQNVDYISREHFPTLPSAKVPNRNWNAILEVSKVGGKANNTYNTQMASSWDNAIGSDAFGNPIPTTAPTWGTGSGTYKVMQGGAITELGEKLADPANWDSTDWDKILNQVSFNEAVNVIASDALGTSSGVPSAGRPNGSDADGPQQIGTVAGLGGVHGTGFPNGTLIGQTWSTSLAYAFGKNYGSDMENVKRSGAYAFGCNIHRSPFAGRSFEYFSEDSYLSGKFAANECRGVAVYGKYAYMKHFACNDQDYQRVGLYTWLTEQALREIYLKPFKECVETGELSAVMSSFNRVGATWAGGSEALLTGVLRNEWQFHGMVITDYNESWELMDQAQAVRAGSNYGMAMTYTYGVFNSNPTLSNSTPRFQHRLRNAVKEVIYGYIHPLLMNKIYNESGESEEYIIVTVSKEPWEYWRPMIISIDGVVICGVIFLAYLTYRPIKDPKVKKEEGDTK